MKVYFLKDDQSIVLKFDSDVMIVITKFAPWIAKKVEDYNYRDAQWRFVNKTFVDFDSERELTNLDFFKETIELNQPEFNRLIIKTLLR